MCWYVLTSQGPALTSQGAKTWGEAKGDVWDHHKPELFKVKPNWNRNISLNRYRGWWWIRINGWGYKPSSDQRWTLRQRQNRTYRTQMYRSWKQSRVCKAKSNFQHIHLWKWEYDLQSCKRSLIILLNAAMTYLSRSFKPNQMTGESGFSPPSAFPSSPIKIPGERNGNTKLLTSHSARSATRLPASSAVKQALVNSRAPSDLFFF